MKSQLLLPLALLAALGGASERAAAQGGAAPYQPRPTTSPYLNLLNRDRSPVLNYYGLTRPEMQFRQQQFNMSRNLQTLQSQVNRNQQQSVLPPIRMIQPRPVITPTGHPTSFNSLGTYYGTR